MGECWSTSVKETTFFFGIAVAVAEFVNDRWGVWSLDDESLVVSNSDESELAEFFTKSLNEF